jgi:hypothetical protein
MVCFSYVFDKKVRTRIQTAIKSRILRIRISNIGLKVVSNEK